MNTVQASTKVKLFDATYDVAYPTVGEKLKIENAKILLTNGQYGDFVRSGHKTALRYLDLVDAFSYLSVLVPAAALTLDKFEILTPAQEKEIRRAYTNDYFPYWNGVEQMFDKEGDDAEQK